MGRGQAFAEVLDDALGGWQAETPLRAGFASSVATTTLFFDIGAELRLPAVAPRARAASRRINHTLTVEQQQALDALVGLGARIDAAFTRHELRTAFRTLALRYHPDRHPHSNDRQKAQLSARFRDITEAYEQLQGVLARP